LSCFTKCTQNKQSSSLSGSEPSVRDDASTDTVSAGLDSRADLDPDKKVDDLEVYKYRVV